MTGDPGRGRALGSLVLALGAATGFLFIAPPPVARANPVSSEACLACHATPSFGVDRQGRHLSLHVDAAALKHSVHAGLECTECHQGFRPDALPHRKPMHAVDCLPCHEGAKQAHPFHAALFAAAGPPCAECHGTHEIVSPKAKGSKLVSGQEAACGRCHAAQAQEYAASAHGRAVAAGVQGAPTCLLCHSQPIAAHNGDRHDAARKIAQEKLCLSCHLNNPEVRARAAPSAGFIAAYEGSVHGRALLAGNGAAANCVDCHGAHQMRKGFDPVARVSRRHIPETCGACHTEEAKVYAGSVHGQALASGNEDAPVCTNCHGEHDIMNPKDPRSPVAPANVSAQVCSPCHSSMRLSAKYGIRSDRFKTFSNTYHGLAIRGGDVSVANCASCHGFHDVRRSSDPLSRVNKANLQATCGQCHPGADARFAAGKVHVTGSEADEPILYWVSFLYIGMIVAVIGGMLLHNVLDFVRKSRRMLRIRRGLEPEPHHPPALYLRMSVNERVQHAVLVLSFATLVTTGFMLHYPDAFWVTWLRHLSDRLFEVRAQLHRAAGVLMVVGALYHVLYLAFSPRGRRLVRDLLPVLGDAKGALGAMAYYLGLRRTPPRFARFSYIEKAEYWALVWGTFVMAATGSILWFEEQAIGLLGKLGWDVARLVHFYEAWLATLAILVWHIYFVVFNPEVYPMNLAWLTGTLTEEEMAAEHPLELEALRREREEAARRAAEEAEPVP